MENVIDSLTEQWNTRLSETASAIVQTLRDAVKIQIFELYHGKDDEEAAKSKAEKEVRTRLTELEKDCRRKAREIFCHIDDHWTLEESLELGLFDKKVWQVFGFSKNSLRVAWAVAGASVGTWIDIATGGGTVGIGALLGAAVGVVIGNLSADEFVKISLPGLHLGPLKIPGRKIGGVSLKAGIERLKGPSVLLDRITCYAVAAARWSHGRRIEVASNRQTDDTCRISRMLENTQDLQQDGTKNDPKGNSAIARFQILIELWHLSCDKTLSTKQERIVHETEAWLKKRLVEHLYRATCEKTENTNNHLKPQID
jgi:hypothetical protein